MRFDDNLLDNEDIQIEVNNVDIPIDGPNQDKPFNEVKYAYNPTANLNPYQNNVPSYFDHTYTHNQKAGGSPSRSHPPNHGPFEDHDPKISYIVKSHQFKAQIHSGLDETEDLFEVTDLCKQQAHHIPSGSFARMISLGEGSNQKRRRKREKTLSKKSMADILSVASQN